MRARGVDRVILNTILDRPWSQYFCCMAFTRSQLVHDYPVAISRCLRAILKTADFCATQPDVAARRLVDEGFVDRYDYAPDADRPAVRHVARVRTGPLAAFQALRLHEVGMIKSSPNRIIANGTDWRFLNELKRELEA